MKLSRNTNFHSASLLFKILAIACIPVLLFVIANVVISYFDIYPVKWLREVHIILQNGLPFFLFLTGSFIANKKLRTLLLIFFPLFLLTYTIKTLDAWEVIDFYEATGNLSKAIGISGLSNVLRIKWIVGVPLLGLLITYTIHFFAKKQKNILDYVKIIWFLTIGYILLSVHFPIGYHVTSIFEISTWILILLMTLGLINFFRKQA